MIVKNDMKKVTLLIPVYNEEAMLPTLYQRLIELVNRNAVYEWESCLSMMQQRHYAGMPPPVEAAGQAGELCQPFA